MRANVNCDKYSEGVSRQILQIQYKVTCESETSDARDRAHALLMD